MFGRKPKEKEKEKERAPRRSDHLSQFGLMDVAGVDEMGNLDDMLEGDDDLEAELAALVSGGGGQPRRPKPKRVPDLDSMVADCMKDYDSHEELSDTEDPDLLAELHGLDDITEEVATVHPMQQQPVYGGDSLLSTIQSRIQIYREAENIANYNGETSKVRRFNRGTKTLQELERAVRAGQPVSEDDIPPQISVGRRREPEESVPALPPASNPEEPALRRAPPPPPRKITPPLEEVSSPIPPSQASIVEDRRKELKALAMAAKNNGDKNSAIEYMRRIKYCDQLIVQLQSDATVDINNLPGLVLESDGAGVQAAGGGGSGVGGVGQGVDVGVVQQSSNNITQEVQGSNPEEPAGPPIPSSIKESLEQRLDKYKAEENRAKAEGNSSKARRMGRIVKQYQEALKLLAAGRPIPREELPDPPGYAPIPLTNHPGLPGSAVKAAAVVVPADATATPGLPPAAASSPAAATASSPKPSAAPTAKQASGVPGASGAKPQIGGGKVSRQTSMMSLQEKQLMGLEKRQKLFKEAALQAKQQGQTDMAREYLKQALSLNKLIEVSKAGLPVDMTTLPVPPQMQVKTNMDFEIISKEDCKVTGDREEMFSKLEQDLIAQVKMCMSNRTYFKEVGEVSSANKFEQMAVHSKKDLDAVRFAFKRGDVVPQFHYETRAFSRVVSFTELTDNDLELTIIAGINYVVKNPKDVDTYVKWEFPFPRETPVIDKTAVIKDTNNPAYDSKFMLVVNPRDKTFQRVVKRAVLKLEVWSKGGFLRSDTLLGTANIKLATLETRCEIHDSFDLYDGRKPVGGKVEVRLRLRNPIISKQIEQAQEKWLVVKF